MKPTHAESLALKYVWGGLATYRPGEAFGPRVLHDFELVWIIEGRATYEALGRAFDAPPGTMVLGVPGRRERYVWDPGGVTRHAYLHFDLDAAPADWPAVECWPVTLQLTGRDPVRPLMKSIIQDWCLGSDAGRRRPPRAIARRFEVMLDGLLCEKTGEKSLKSSDYLPAPPAVQRAMDWVHAALRRDPGAPIDLEDLAAAASVTPKHLCRLFNGAVGQSPMRVVRAMRLQWAMGMLTRSNLSVAQVADRCGFVSPFHFSRSFTQVFGRSPTQVRRLAAAGQPLPTSPLRVGLWGSEAW